jgi:ADP-ribose pyrophosphatase YjhB (NUDIX family)
VAGGQRIGVYGLAERDGEVLLTRLARGTHRGRWTLPGGRLEFGERPVEALARELREETGLQARVDGLLDVDAAVVDFESAGGPVRTHLVPIVYRVTVVGGVLGVTEAGGSTDDARWWARDGVADGELTPFAVALLRTGRLAG